MVLQDTFSEFTLKGLLTIFLKLLLLILLPYAIFINFICKYCVENDGTRFLISNFYFLLLILFVRNYYGRVQFLKSNFHKMMQFEFTENIFFC